MTRSLGPPTVPGQIGETKQRVFDLERRLQRRESEECCGETQIFGTRHKETGFSQVNEGLYHATMLPLTITNTYTRVRIGAQFTFGWLKSQGNGYWLQASILLYDGFSYAYMPDSAVYALESHNTRATDSYTLQITVDLPQGNWFVLIEVETRNVLSFDCEGNIQTSEPNTNAELLRPQINAIYGQVMDYQELWPWYAPPA